MKKKLLPKLFFAFCCVLALNVVVNAKPTWEFTVIVAVEKQTASLYESMLSKNINQIVKEQIATVNANFNRSSGFNGTYNFEVDSIYVFDGPANVEVFRPHSTYTYAVVIDGFSTTSLGGGWFGDNQVIYHKWSASKFFESGPFGPGATDGLTHEFGHARGAVDIYGMRVEGAKNPVNGQTFEPVNSIMNYPYGNIVWDEYTINLLNETADGPIIGEQWITKPFPSAITVQAVDSRGQSLEGVTLEVYPIDWFSYSVSPSPILRSTTLANGTYVFGTNPFQPSTSGYPWNIRYSNFLVKAIYNSAVVYKWIPLYEVQNTYFQYGPNSVYKAVIQFPVINPIIQITSVNAQNFKANDSIVVAFSVGGNFEQGNTFSLHLVDDRNNTYIIQTVEGTHNATLTGIVPLFTTTQIYKIRIVSSKPVSRSNDVEIRINPAPLTLLAPWYNCQTGEIRFNPSGGNGTPITYIAPGIKRTMSTDPGGIVEAGLRNDPKVIPITAIQSGFRVTYNFDLRTVCGTHPLPPILVQSIPNQSFTINKDLPGSGFAVGLYFADPTPYIPNYSSGWNFEVTGLPPGLEVFSKPMTGIGSPTWVIVGTPNSLGDYTVTLKARTAAFPDKPVITNFKITIVPDSNPTTPLTMLSPTYDCQTGKITFNIQGGDGSPITYRAPGITRSSLSSPTGIVEAGLRADPKPIPIEAMQREHKVTYVFDIKAYCERPNPPSGALELLPPNYDCVSGAFHFNSRGGDSSPIEFRAAGITDWTRIRDQYVDVGLRTAQDVKPFLLLARQSGYQVSATWDLKAHCGRARMGISSVDENLSIQVLGNPVYDLVRVLIKGIDGLSVQLRLMNERGQVLENRLINLTASTEEQRFRISQLGPGIYFLQVTSTNGRQTVKILRQ